MIILRLTVKIRELLCVYDFRLGRIADVKQCCVVYDSLSNRFFLTPGPGAATYLNDSLLENPRELIMGDVIGMGNSKFEFIPFCREGHVWKIEES